MTRSVKSLVVSTIAFGTCALSATSNAHAAVNLLVGHVDYWAAGGYYGVLRPGSGWDAGSTFNLAFQSLVTDGHLLAEGTQWNTGTWWWDEDPSVNGVYPTPMGTRLGLSSTLTMNRFVVQADNNDTYQIDYWDGTNWLPAWTVPAVAGWGMTTRDSGLLPTNITTTQLRFYAVGGDNYYSVSEIQAYAIPEPSTYALTALGLFALVLSRQLQRRS